MGRHAAALFAFFRRLGCSPAGAEDLVQTAVVRLYQTRRRYQSGRPFRPWLYGIAWRVWRDHQRRARRERRQAPPEEEPLEEVPSTAPDPFQRAQEAQEQTRVRQAVQRLPASQRLALILRHYHGLTYEELARVQGVPPGTAKWRVHQAMATVRRYLQRPQGGSRVP